MWPFRTDSGIPTFPVDNTIAEGTCLRGDLQGPGGFRVDGRIEGSIEAEGAVIIGEKGAALGGVVARDVVVFGEVRGDVVVSGHLEIGPHGRIIGDVTTGSFRMHTGGTFRGTSRMADEARVLPSSRAPAELDAQRIRTLPPPAGAVPPPAAVTAEPGSPAVLSEERLRASGES